EYRLLFAGDLVFGRRYPTLLADGDPGTLVSALHGLLAMNVDVIIPGHGSICDMSEVEKAIAYWECLVRACRSHLTAGWAAQGVVEKLYDHCHLPEIPFDGKRHSRNVRSVCEILSARNSRM
ncbi:MAG: hypothetical protein JSV44_00595, partial [Candidatus Zixiibacteriota bacterium]